MADEVPGFTFYGDYAKKADEYKAYFDQLIGCLLAARERLQEQAVVEKVDIPPLNIPGLTPPGDKTEIPWGTIGVVVAVGLVLWSVTSGKQTPVAGLRKHRRRRR